MKILFKGSATTRENIVTIKKRDWLMLFWEVSTLCCGSHRKHKYTVCEKAGV